MKKNLNLFALGACCLMGISAYGQHHVALGSLDIIPAPREIKMENGRQPFVLTSSTEIVYPRGNEKMQRNAAFLASYIKLLTGTTVKLSATDHGGHAIILALDDAVQQREGYELQVSSERILLKGKTEAGVFYGIQTLHKALPVSVSGHQPAAIPCGTVKDAPRFDYRGFMIDVGRHYFPTSYIKEIIDMLALHNINYFHWHLSEDQGWRIEIKKYPRLTEIGSKRKETIKNWETKEMDGTPTGGYYTQQEAREIVAYAAERYITVIPEIDMPGHMLAALASYPELGCTGGPYEVATTFGVFPDVLCGGKDRTLQFAKDVVDEIMDIFPSPYIHIGGDECPKVRWKTCPACQEKIRQLGLTDTPEHTKENRLQAWFMGEVEKEIQKRGRKMLAWDEILAGNPAKTTTVMAWTSPQARVKSVEEGYRTIACPISNLYFSNPNYNRLTGVNSVARVYNFEPVPDGVGEDARKRVIGAEGCIWTEWTKDSVKMEWQMMPRIAALAEIQWSTPQRKQLESFLHRLPHQLELYTAHGYHYKQDIYDVNIHAGKPVNGRVEVSLVSFDDAPIYYTTDGSVPTEQSQRYERPFTLPAGVTVKAVAVRRQGRSAVAELKL